MQTNINDGKLELQVFSVNYTSIIILILIYYRMVQSNTTITNSNQSISLSISNISIQHRSTSAKDRKPDIHSVISNINSPWTLAFHSDLCFIIQTQSGYCKYIK